MINKQCFQVEPWVQVGGDGREVVSSQEDDSFPWGVETACGARGGCSSEVFCSSRRQKAAERKPS